MKVRMKKEKVTKKNKQKTKTEENVMRKRILGIAAISICLFLAGCSYQDYKEGTGVFYEGPQKSEFGLRTYKSSETESVSVYVDEETGVNYLIFSGRRKGNITPRYNADGSLYITKPTR